MRTIPAGLAAAALLAAAAGSTPATAMPIADLGATQANPAAGDTVQVQWRRYHRYWGYRPYWRHRYYGYRYNPYYSYGYYPYRRYYGGPSFYVGPRGFGFGWW